MRLHWMMFNYFGARILAARWMIFAEIKWNRSHAKQLRTISTRFANIFNDNGTHFFHTPFSISCPLCVSSSDSFAKIKQKSNREKKFRTYIHLLLYFFFVLPKPKILNGFSVVFVIYFSPDVFAFQWYRFLCASEASYWRRIFLTPALESKSMALNRQIPCVVVLFCLSVCYTFNDKNGLHRAYECLTLFISMPHLLWCVEW